MGKPVGRPRTNEVATHCVNGHVYTAQNTYRYPSGKKVCKICRMNSQRKYKGMPPLEREQIGTWNRDKDCCPAGHEYTPENTYAKKQRNGTWGRSCRRCQRDAHLRRRYGLSPEQYAALVAAQQGACAICQTVLEEGRNLHVDHDHTTGAVRGLLCDDCNFGLGKFKDDIEVLRVAVRYLQKASRSNQGSR